VPCMAHVPRFENLCMYRQLKSFCLEGNLNPIFGSSYKRNLLLYSSQLNGLHVATWELGPAPPQYLPLRVIEGTNVTPPPATACSSVHGVSPSPAPLYWGPTNSSVPYQSDTKPVGNFLCVCAVLCVTILCACCC
jgi:hypothetical protein